MASTPNPSRGVGHTRVDHGTDTSRRIDALCDERGWTQEQLALRLEVSRGTLSNWRKSAPLPRRVDRILSDLIRFPAYDPARPDTYIITRRRTWSAARRAYHSRRMRRRCREDPGTIAHLRLMTERHAELPHTGPYETNQEAKLWRLVAPDGARYEVRNLRLWCERNVGLFEAGTTATQAYAGLRQVNAWLRGKTQRKVSTYKGWTLDGPAEEIPTAT